MNASWKNVVGMAAVSFIGGWACTAAVAQTQEVCTTITFSEEVETVMSGFNNEENQFLISDDGQYRVEAFSFDVGFLPTDTSGVFNLASDESEDKCVQTQPPSSFVDNVDGIRITRIDGGPFTLQSMDLDGEAWVGFSDDGSGIWETYSRLDSPIDFESDFVDMNEIFLTAPHDIEPQEIPSCWDNIVLCADDIPNPSGGAVAVDIHPSSCPNPLNIKAGGLIPVAICGTADLDVRDIDPSSIMLMGISASRYAYEDVATPYAPFVDKQGCLDCTDAHGDGFLDLTLKFKAQDVLEIVALCYGDENCELEDGACLVLTLSGTLGGEEIHGEDVVKIVGTRQRGATAKKKK